MAATRRRRLRPATIATLLLALFVLLPTAAATPSTSGEDSPEVELTITSITPVVDDDGTALVRGQLTNTGDSALTDPDVEVVPQTASDSRAELATWAEGSDPIDEEPAASTMLDEIAPDDSAAFTLEVDAADLAADVDAGAAWVSVQTEQTAVHTFIGVHRAKEYVPLEVVWGVPLLLPSDRQLFGTPGTTRTQAWQDAVGPDSRLAQLTREEPSSDEAWLLDPTLLSVPAEPTEGTEGIDPDQSEAMDAERDVRDERATELRESVVGKRTIVLPEADADVSAGAASDAVASVMAPRLEGGRTVADELDAEADVMWPADGLVTQQSTRGLRGLHPGRTAPTVLTHSSALAPSGFTATGAARTTHGAPLLVSDTPLSAVVGDLSSPEDVTLARQRLIAETAVILGERPGTSRTLFIVPDRSTMPSPEAYAALQQAVGPVPWLERGSLSSLMEQADEAPADRVPRTAQQLKNSSAGPAPPAVLTKGQARQITDDKRSASTFASVRSDGPMWQATVDTTLNQLTSARWRTAPDDFTQLHEDVSRDVSLTREDIVVSSGDVNFFADTGRLQITIVNNTDVQLSNLTVDVTSEHPSFRIEGPPDPVTIGPNGRQKVTVEATALAAGRTPVHVVVTTPDGEELTDAATLRVRMRPTGATVYWVIGGTAAVLLAAGTWRSVRRPRKTTVNEDDP